MSEPRYPQTSATAADRQGRWIELDGVRAIAILGVMAFHAGLSFLQGGFFGVDIFFTLSGFLITTILLRERDRSGTISLRDFYRPPFAYGPLLVS